MAETPSNISVENAMKVLVLSYFFSPSTCANGKRPFYITKGFLDAGCDVDVFSSNRLVPAGQSEMISHPNLTINRIEDPYDILDHKLSGRVGQLVGSCFRGLLWPDSYGLWALRVIRRIDLSRYDRVLVCVMPISMLIFSLFKGISSRWIFDYSESYLPQMVVRRKSPLIHLLYPLLMKLQRWVLHRAGAVLFTSESTRRGYLEAGLVEKEKAVHIPLFYDGAAYKNAPAPPDQFVIGYMGKFGDHKGVRSPDVFFNALSLFLERVPLAREKIRFVFHGRWNAMHTPLIHQYELEDVVEINASVPPGRYMELLGESTVLLLVASPEQNLLIPSKMLDYFGARRPILAFVPIESETFSMLEEAGMAAFASEENDAETGARCLERMWVEWSSRQLSCEKSKVGRWAVDFQMPRILEIFQEMK